MDGGFVGVLKQEWHGEDIKALTNHIREHESTMRLKRRWLMDLPLSEKEQSRIEDLLFPNNKIMPESFLREDDVSYEDIKTCIEMAFGVHNSLEQSAIAKEEILELNSCDGFQKISFLLDAMTNKGLCSFVKILTGELINFDKTNLAMKITIRELLPKVIAEKNDISKAKQERCSLLLKDPTNFHGNQMVHDTASESYHAAAVKILDGLKDFPSRTLHVMRRKLKGVKGYIPRLKTPKTGSGLINVVRKRCMKMLSEIGTLGGEPAEQLAGALGAAGLTLKLIMNCPDVRDFRRFSPEMETLHNDIAKAFHLVSEPKKVSSTDLRKVLHLLDPNYKLSVGSLRGAVRNLLIEYLCECSDMDGIPDILRETLEIINRRPQLRSSKKSSSSKDFSSSKEAMKDEIKKEIQHVLDISAQAKEVVANLLPEHEFDEEFALAYMEDFDDSDTFFDDGEKMEENYEHFEFRSNSSYNQTESVGETNLIEFNSPVSCLPLSQKSRSNMDSESMHLDKMNSDETFQTPSCTKQESGQAYSDSVKVITKPSIFSPSYSSARKSIHSEMKSEETSSPTTKYEISDFQVEEIVPQQRRSVNKYLELQEACDNTSMVAYRFVGYMLDTLAKTEGLELYQDDRSYLRSYTSLPEDTVEVSDTLSKFSKMWKNVLEH